MNAKRGYVPEDDNNFSDAALEKMRTASRHICYLINEGYDIKQASTFVGNPFKLDIQILKEVDKTLWEKENVITADAIILDHCISWMNLLKLCVEDHNASTLKVWEM